jgi:hypothetical protein
MPKTLDGCLSIVCDVLGKQGVDITGITGDISFGELIRYVDKLKDAKSPFSCFEHFITAQAAYMRHWMNHFGIEVNDVNAAKVIDNEDYQQCFWGWYHGRYMQNVISFD